MSRTQNARDAVALAQTVISSKLRGHALDSPATLLIQAGLQYAQIKQLKTSDGDCAIRFERALLALYELGNDVELKINGQTVLLLDTGLPSAP